MDGTEEFLSLFSFAPHSSFPRDRAAPALGERAHHSAPAPRSPLRARTLTLAPARSRERSHLATPMPSARSDGRLPRRARSRRGRRARRGPARSKAAPTREQDLRGGLAAGGGLGAGKMTSTGAVTSPRAKPRRARQPRHEAAPAREPVLGGGLAVRGGRRPEEVPALEASRRGRPVGRGRSPSAGRARSVGANKRAVLDPFRGRGNRGEKKYGKVLRWHSSG